MTRTLITISEDDKRWLDHYSRAHQQSMAETIRQAVSDFRTRLSGHTQDALLEETAGIWRRRAVDALDYTRGLRDEWESRDP
ncbi:MAG: hypothetical protein COZ06_00160 [Armatimonadetes bacterium CG_4_10_14_3_um_filter_66_18]|nr:MAG: hypothetical protein COS65_08890 [Armatimonadetes bacterium CG06_land_8_20_14_3_00_66_21]PIX44144.1 MAG: hypothetical protein COZ57_17975 [Armatimonadetes bacterium CG_4_8_14_3_um_filter_66_20]PIY54374.1 MAG: hypothetical protein COZ06_00160 [Armatimonadetes bacterium CG_4_10_14_3_um_filter_66_18]PIZ43086.1 MAG: hypothetical protein COY42_16465 [Armatimonadetes bacterium CG_4_10_14_0_8_um_filter_66_14]PJB73723.1 MAG: hypothetical protein CO096_05260 [Armatimonadetes bacterium CG_4_9_14_